MPTTRHEIKKNEIELSLQRSGLGQEDRISKDPVQDKRTGKDPVQDKRTGSLT
jgi:hypothetical protein